MKTLRTTLQDRGQLTISSYDFGVDYCGYAKAKVKLEDGVVKYEESESGVCETIKSEDKSKAGLLRRYIALSDRLSKIAGVCDKYILEIPGGAIYESGTSRRSAMIKRANGIRDLQSSIFFFIERLANDVTESRVDRRFFYTRFFFIEPSQWQDKSEIKLFKDSKDWSIDKANSIKFSDRKIKISHEADAITMMNEMLIK